MSAVLQPTDREVIAQAVRIANASVISDIESEGRCVMYEGATWWDITGMVHPREHSSQVIDQARQAIDYAVAAGVITVHPHHAYLVRILRS